MFSKTFLTFLVVYLFSDLSYGKSNQIYFRKDYNCIEALGNYYKYHTTPKTWLDAKQECDQEGATLFYPENSDEVNAVTSFWKMYQNNTLTNNTWVYVGLSDIVREGVFETIDGKSISEVYNQWKVGMPDNSGDEDCVHINQIGNYNDIACSSEYSFICKKSFRSLDPNYSCAKLQSNSDGQRDKKFFRQDYTYIETSQGFYKMHTIPKNFADAKRMCALEGASLFYPENSNEANAVVSFWNRTQPTIPSVHAGISAEIAKGVFETIDHKPVSEGYNNWQAGEPNDALGTEDCGWLKKETGTFYDGPCDVKFPFICKKSLQSLEWDDNCNMPNLDYIFNKGIGKCYKFHTTPLTWTEAYAVCSAEQSYLAVITNRTEANYLAMLTEYAPEQRAKGDYLRGLYHVGFQNRVNEGWQTVKGIPFNDSDAWWGNYQPEADDREQCGAMFFNGLLTHINCDLRSFFICEHERVNTRSREEEN